MVGWHFAGTLAVNFNESSIARNRFNFKLVVIRQSHSERVKAWAKVCRSCRNLDRYFSADKRGHD